MDPAPASSAPSTQAQSTKGPKSVQIADEHDGDNSPTTITYTLGGRSSGRSTSVHSGSFSSASSERDSIERDYVQIHPRRRYPSPDEEDEEDEDDDIEPSDSASRSRRTTSRRHTTEARAAPTRRHSSRRVLERGEEPRRHSSHRHQSSRSTRRSEPRRTASDESSSVASYEYERYGHHGAPEPPRPHYPPLAGVRHVAAQSHGGYQPSVTSAPYAHDPFAAQQALVQLGGQDVFGYPPSQNPFSPHSGPGNPFSPISAGGGSSYFGGDPHALPGAPMPPQQRPHGSSRPQSFAAPSQFGAPPYGSDMAMTHYPASIHPTMAPPGIVSSNLASGLTGYPYGFPGMAYPPIPYQLPPSHTVTPPPPAAPAPAPAASPKEEKEEEKNERDEKTSAEIQALKDLIAKHEEARLAAEAERLAKAEADAAAAAAEKAAAEAEKRKKEEIAAASKKAKEDAEKAAGEAAKKAKEEHDKAAAAAKEEHEKAAAAAKEEHEKKVAELQKAHDEAEKKQKELAAEVEKNKPMPDMLQAPIKFKDAVGRKFSFPWHLCKTWKGMEGLIKQAFLHVDVIGEHVHQGHYDLTGPDGEIILPQVWDTMVQPEWEISMHMWPMPEPEPEPPKKDDKHAHDFPLGDHFLDFGNLGLVDRPKKDKGKKDKKKGQRISPEVIAVPPMPPGAGSPTIPLPPPGLAGFDGPLIFSPEEKKHGRPKAKSKSSKEISGLTAWMIGSAPRSKKDDEKLDFVKHKPPTAHLPSSKNGSADQTNCVLM